jgi:zinc-binding alcohol dehydrogenase family protein
LDAQSVDVSNPESLIDVTLDQPIANGRDLLIKVNAISVNPADYKVRVNMPPIDGAVKVIGWDAVGEVIATGDKASQFKPGDVVYYAGDINRQGCNAEYQLVDERLVGFKPKSLSNAEAAALPLTAITAWELLFEHLSIKQQSPASIEKSNEVILVVGAAGGVGSIFVQLTKTITGATVIATASRESSSAWVKKLGADYVVDHTKPLAAQIEALNIGPVTHVASLNSTDSYFESYTELLAPFGKIAMIDDPEALDVTKLKLKSLSLHWEFMFARSMFNAADMDEQGR